MNVPVSTQQVCSAPGAFGFAKAEGFLLWRIMKYSRKLVIL